MIRAGRLALALVAVLPSLACGVDASRGDAIVVLAASSLTESFTALGDLFEAEHPRADVTFSFASSSELAVQVVEAAPADVYASADTVHMRIVEDAGLARDAVAFATNRLVIVTPSDDPARVDAAGDLARAGVKVVLAGPEVPAGRYARAAFAELGIADEVERNLVSNEDDVKQVVAKVRLGEADAGVVYVTDVTDEVAEDVDVIDLPAAVEVEAVYSIAVLREAPNAADARDFVDFVLSEEGRDVLHRHGFGSP